MPKTRLSVTSLSDGRGFLEKLRGLTNVRHRVRSRRVFFYSTLSKRPIWNGVGCVDLNHRFEAGGPRLTVSGDKNRVEN